MPKSTPNKRTRRVRNRPTYTYADDPREVESRRNITVSQTTSGRILHSNTLATKLVETRASINGDFADPWTTGFFDSNTEAFVIDSPPADELLDSDPLESQPQPKDRRKVRVPFTFECSLINKDSSIRPSRFLKPGK
jgi:hypothetical protein